MVVRISAKRDDGEDFGENGKQSKNGKKEDSEDFGEDGKQRWCGEDMTKNEMAARILVKIAGKDGDGGEDFGEDGSEDFGEDRKKSGRISAGWCPALNHVIFNANVLRVNSLLAPLTHSNPRGLFYAGTGMDAEGANMNHDDTGSTTSIHSLPSPVLLTSTSRGLRP
ncbi:hypothetical protein BC938DRAFT_482665 [Jimgerdemannia flammicorona]|uniref:Uncharacterized protein n=1 Tax=Jimgerdemannia flammicorona TaxID=994334 RepID=A0A433QDF2_9FUNG|nr:hypothetical protein BC938DRAFT_482665 [Jimgerdemannia flammicorona]